MPLSSSGDELWLPDPPRPEHCVQAFVQRIPKISGGGSTKKQMSFFCVFFFQFWHYFCFYVVFARFVFVFCVCVVFFLLIIFYFFLGIVFLELEKIHSLA